MKKLIFSITLLLLSANLQAEEYYRSIDAKGRVNYGDVPAQGAEDIERLNSRPEPNADDALPFETRRAHAKFPVTLYIGEGCGNGCSQARALLKRRGIPYTEHNVATAADISAYKQATGGLQIPALHIGSDWLITFIESRWSQALDAAGYPKNLPYGFQPQVKHTPATESTQNP